MPSKRQVSQVEKATAQLAQAASTGWPRLEPLLGEGNS